MSILSTESTTVSKSTPLYVIGIDAGQKGGIATHLGGAWTARILPMMPSGKGNRVVLDVGAFADIMLELVSVRFPDLVLVEKPPLIPKNGCLATSGLFQGYGEIRGVIAALYLYAGRRLPAEYVPAQEWMKEILPGRAKGEKASVPYVREKHPNIDIVAKIKASGPNKGQAEYHDGMADALCVAEYGLRKLKGE